MLSLKSTSSGMITVGRLGEGVIEGQEQINLTITIDQVLIFAKCLIISIVAP